MVHYTHTHTHAFERSAIAGMEWPSGVPGFFPVGRSTMFRWTAVFLIDLINYYYFYFYFFLLHLALVTYYDNSPGTHSREVTIGPVACLFKEYLAQWPYVTLSTAPSHFIHKNIGLWQFWQLAQSK